MVQKIVEGQTATNPKTGEKIVYRGGRWFPMGASGQSGASAKALTAQESGQLTASRNAARMADEAARTAEQFAALNEQRGTGLAYAIPGIKSLRGGMDATVNQMNALTARMAPQQRVPGSGTTSDRDLSLYLSAVPSLEKPGNANGAIAKQARADAQRRSEYAQFLDRFATENGTLIGSEAAWENHLAAAAPSRARQSAPARPTAARPATAQSAAGKVRRYNPATGRIE